MKHTGIRIFWVTVGAFISLFVFAAVWWFGPYVRFHSEEVELVSEIAAESVEELKGDNTEFFVGSALGFESFVIESLQHKFPDLKIRPLGDLPKSECMAMPCPPENRLYVELSWQEIWHVAQVDVATFNGGRSYLLIYAFGRWRTVLQRGWVT